MNGRAAPRQVILVAAGGLARETLSVIARDPGLVASGLLDDDEAMHGRRVAGLPVLGGTERIVDHPGASVVVCAGKGSAREAIVARLGSLGVGPERFASVVHPSVDVPAGCTVGAGSILLAGVVLTADVSLGVHVVVMPHATLTHDCQVRDYATVCAGVTLGGGVQIGRAAYLGMGACVREGVQVGDRAVLGMGAVLLGDQPAASTWAGVPARALASR